MATNEVKYKFTAEDSQFKKVAGNVTGELKKMAKDGTLGVAAMSAAFYALGRSMQDTLNLMDQISKMSAKTGFGVKELSALKYAADLSGVSLETLEKSFIKFNKAIASNSPAFAKINVDLKNLDGTLKKPEDTLLDVADAFAGMEASAQKTSIAVELFGKSGADMIPLLNEGKGGINALKKAAEEAGITFDEVAAKKAERFNDAITKMGYTAKGFTQELVTALMPAFDSMSTAMENASGGSTKLTGNLTLMQAIARGLAAGFFLVTIGVIGAGESIALLVIAVVDAVKYLGSLITMMYQFSQGDLVGGMKTWDLANAKAFQNTSAMWKKLKDDSFKNISDFKNMTLGRSTGGDVVVPKTGGSTDSDSATGSAKSGKDKVELKTIEYDELKKKDAGYLRDKQKWEYENQNATIKEKLKREEDYLLKRKKLWAEYLETDEFKFNEIIEPAFGGKLYDSLTELDQTIKNNTAAIQEADNEKPKQLLKSAVKKVDADKATLQQVLDATAYKFEIQDMLYAHEEFMNVDNPTFANNEFDALENEKNAANTEFIREAGYPDDFIEMDKKVLSNLDKKYKGYKEEPAKAVTKGLLTEEELPKIQAQLDANKIVERERLEKNHADYLLELEDQLWEGKMNIWSNAMGALAGLFAENTVAYKAFAIAQATIDAWVGANAALKLPFPLNWVQFASVLATGLGSVTKIMDVKIPAFANGGLVNSPTLGIMGEAGAEIIAPERDFLDYTNNIKSTAIAQSNSNMFSNALKNMKFKLVGKDLVLAYDKNKLSDTRLRTA